MEVYPFGHKLPTLARKQLMIQFGKWVQRVAGNKFALTNDAISELQKMNLID